MPFEKGDFVLIDFVARVKETGEVFDTTNEDVARKEKLYKEGEIYEPNLVVIGENWVLKALDESLVTFELSQTKPTEISPEKAFGNRDPEKVRLVPLKRLLAKGITPQIGMRVEYEGKLAIVRTLGAGRVQLDFNPPLAGKTLVYEVTVQKKLETNAEKMNALVHRRIPAVDVTKFLIKTKKIAVDIEVPEEAFYIEGLQAAKRGIAIDLQKFFPEKETIRFIETFKKKTPSVEKTAPKEQIPEKAAETEAKPAQAETAEPAGT
jgi:FKBP-type peptidyl-prolyl cis-trans isomerase 2